MLTKRHRFHGYGSLKKVYAHGQTTRGQLMSLKYAKRRPDQPYRVAVVVSRKVHKSAVVRNRIRRRMYEVVRKQSVEPKAMDLVFLVYAEQCATIEAEKLERIVTDLLQKAVASSA